VYFLNKLYQSCDTFYHSQLQVHKRIMISQTILFRMFKYWYNLKGQSYEIFILCFFRQTIPLGPLIHGLMLFWKYIPIHGGIRFDSITKINSLLKIFQKFCAMFFGIARSWNKILSAFTESVKATVYHKIGHRGSCLPQGSKIKF
jgi:hypothetical protein